MKKIYLILLNNYQDPGPTWVGPIDNMATAETLIKEVSCKGYIETMEVKPNLLTTGKIMNLSDYRKSLLLEP